ncbi:MAG: M48 family metallopeptidase [Moraxellaceae bacterium]|nr:M48 family metallopeptidase [Moraxellaceae bacterium]MCC6200131.1 M48 family metallopeptidase [Moraxellaceae bacterium]
MILTRRQVFVLPLILLLAACASTTQEGATGVKRKQLLLLPSAQVDAMSLESYRGELSKASGAGKLNTDKANLERIRVIADRLIPHVATFRQDALAWQWEVNLETRDELNAYCAPGGKIMFFTGIIKQLNLSDDEIAAIMGHEIAHALREHGRERMSQAYAQQTGMSLLAVLGNVKPENMALLETAAQLGLTLPHSRGQEAEADIVGLELMARAGYNPAAAVSLWEKMGQANGPGGPAFMSTHPSGAQRIDGIGALLPKVNPLYQSAKGTRSKTAPRVVPRG